MKISSFASPLFILASPIPPLRADVGIRWYYDDGFPKVCDLRLDGASHLTFLYSTSSPLIYDTASPSPAPRISHNWLLWILLLARQALVGAQNFFLFFFFFNLQIHEMRFCRARATRHGERKNVKLRGNDKYVLCFQLKLTAVIWFFFPSPKPKSDVRSLKRESTSVGKKRHKTSRGACNVISCRRVTEIYFHVVEKRVLSDWRD